MLKALYQTLFVSNFSISIPFFKEQTGSFFFVFDIKFLVKYVLIFGDILDHLGSKLDPLEMQYYVSERKKRKKNEYHR